MSAHNPTGIFCPSIHQKRRRGASLPAAIFAAALFAQSATHAASGFEASVNMTKSLINATEQLIRRGPAADSNFRDLVADNVIAINDKLDEALQSLLHPELEYPEFYAYLDRLGLCAECLGRQPNTLVLLNAIDVTGVALDNVKHLYVVKKYDPTGLSLANCRNLETLGFFDGDLTDSLRTDVQNLAKNQDMLKELDVKRWGAPSLAASAFAGAAALQQLIGFTDVTGLGASAFSGCSALTSIPFASALTSLPNSAFLNCLALTIANFPNITTLGTRVFEGCALLPSVSFSPSLTSLPNSTFKNCAALTSVDCSNVTTLGTSIFEGCASLPSVSFSPSLTSLPDSTFKNCATLTSVDCSNVTTLGTSIFEGCASLQRITSEKGLQDGVSFSSSLTLLPGSTFKNCTSLARVELEKIRSLGASVFEGCRALTRVVISSATTSLPDNAFKLCLSLTTSSFTYGLRDGGHILRNVTTLGREAFAGCTALNTYYGDITNTDTWLFRKVSTVGTAAFADCRFTALALGECTTFDPKIVAGCTQLKTLLLPRVRTLPAGSFPITPTWSITENWLIPANISTINCGVDPNIYNLYIASPSYYSDPSAVSSLQTQIASCLSKLKEKNANWTYSGYLHFEVQWFTPMDQRASGEGFLKNTLIPLLINMPSSVLPSGVSIANRYIELAGCFPGLTESEFSSYVRSVPFTGAGNDYLFNVILGKYFYNFSSYCSYNQSR
jgi:hypothetical protein